MHKSMTIIALATLGLALQSGCTNENRARAAEESVFLRVADKGPGPGHLDTAIVTYKNKEGITVDLIGVVHLADPVYYKGLQLLFGKYDGLLYEMIASPNARPGGKGEKRKSGNSLLSTIQRTMCSSLQLTFQLDAIDYTRNNFIHADLTPAEFAQAWKDSGQTIWGLILRAFLVSAQAQQSGKGEAMNESLVLAALLSKDRAENLKFLFAKEMEKVEVLMACLGGKKGEESVILGTRNKTAIDVLKREISGGKKKLGIFYGAAHMPDLEMRLTREMGYTKVKQSWLHAWTYKIPKLKQPKKKKGK